MTFICSYCSSALEQIGLINHFVCLKCKKLFEVKIEINEINDANSRKLLPEKET